MTDYLRLWLIPGLPLFPFYRPIKGVEWLVCFFIFRGDASGYHLAQILLHVAGTALLFSSVERVTRNWRFSLIAALVYLTLPMYGLAIFWAGVSDPLVAFFSLLSVRLWISYLDRGIWLEWLLAFVAFLAALMSKESALGLAIILFLVDRWLIGCPASLVQLAKRYLAFGIGTVLYVLI